ncbi:MAG: hypothetical protein R3E89_02620 [Thiolinea sp.]
MILSGETPYACQGYRVPDDFDDLSVGTLYWSEPGQYYDHST